MILLFSMCWFVLISCFSNFQGGKHHLLLELLILVLRDSRNFSLVRRKLQSQYTQRASFFCFFSTIVIFPFIMSLFIWIFKGCLLVIFLSMVFFFVGPFKYVIQLWCGLNIFSWLLPILAIEFHGYVIILHANYLTYWFVIESLRNKCVVNFSQFESSYNKRYRKCVFTVSQLELLQLVIMPSSETFYNYQIYHNSDRYI